LSDNLNEWSLKGSDTQQSWSVDQRVQCPLCWTRGALYAH